MHEQVRGRDAGLKGAGSKRRVALRAAVGVRDGCEISARNLLAIEVASQQVLDAGAVPKIRAIDAPACADDARQAAASGFSSAASSRAATARTAASMSAIWAGNKSRNRPEIRQVTSTRGRPALAVGRTSTPVTRPVA